MIKRELKINSKSLIIWIVISISLFLMAFAIYPTIMDNNNSDMINQMLEMFPEEVLKMFNMDISNIDSVYGWFKTEGYTILTLIVGLYAGILGSNMLVKEESDKTISFLISKPINRNQIVTSKIVSGLINITVLILAVTIFNLIGMYLSNDLVLKPFLLLSLTPLLICYPVYLLTMFISCFFNKTKKTLGIGIGIVFVSYFLQMIAQMSDKVDFIKYLSLFTLSNSRYIIEHGSFNILYLFISLLISIVCSIGIYIKYNHKEVE